MALDIDLPLWTVRPNWRNGVLERLEWLTDFIESTYGTVQTRALRLSPRRAFEMTFNPVGEARSYFDLWLHRMGSTEFMLPLFHDRGRLSSAIASGATVIPLDTEDREFIEGGLAVLIGEEPFTYDKLEVVSVALGSITVEVGNVTQAWPKGASIYPLRRSRISQENTFAVLTNRVGEAAIEFQLNQDNDIIDEGSWPLSYQDLPVLTDKPNWRESRDFTFIRNLLLLDNEHGLRLISDDADRAFTVQVHNHLIRGRAAHADFRRFLYRLRGMDAPIWVPTFNEDFVLSSSRSAADALLDVKKIGYAYTGGAVSGRRHVIIDDSIMREINAVGAAPSTAEERLTLTAALGADLPVGTTGSFMEPCRQAQDMVEITHYTDTDGTAECNLSFKAFRHERTTPEPIYYPIQEAVMSNSPCGEGAPVAECEDQPQHFDVSYEIVMPLNEPVPKASDDELIDAYRWFVETGNIFVRWPDCSVEGCGHVYLGSGGWTIAPFGPVSAQLSQTIELSHPEYGSTDLVFTAVRVGPLLTITIDNPDHLVTLYGQWNESGSWTTGNLAILFITGQNNVNGWTNTSYAPSIVINYAGESGAPAYIDDDGFSVDPDNQLRYTYYFAPYIRVGV